MRVDQLKIGVILSYVSMFAGTIVSICYTPIMIHLLGQSEYGIYNLVNSIVSYLGLLTMGFGSSYIRFYSRYKFNKNEDKIAKLNGLFLLVFLVLAFIAFVCGLILVENINNLLSGGFKTDEIALARNLMIILVFNIAISFPMSVFDAIVISQEKFIFQKTLLLIKTVFNPLIALPLLLCGFKSVSLVIATTLITLITCILNIYYCFKKLNTRFSFKNLEFTLLKEIWNFSFYIFLNMIIDQINWQVDKFIIAKYINSIAVAIYSVAAQLNTYYMSISTSISSVFAPRVNRIVVCDNIDTNSRLLDLMIKVGRLQFVVLSLVLGGFILFGEFFIKVWAGSGFGEESYFITLLLIIPVTVPLIQNLGMEIQRAKNMHQFRSIILNISRDMHHRYTV